MSIKAQLKADLIKAMKEKREDALSTLKMIVSAIQNEEIKLIKKEGLTDDEVLKVLRSEAKKRKDAIEAYAGAGRNDLKEKEEKELSIIEQYLPKQMDDAVLEKKVKQVLEKHKGATAKDFGAIMKEVMAETNGQADGKRVSEIVKKML